MSQLILFSRVGVWFLFCLLPLATPAEITFDPCQRSLAAPSGSTEESLLALIAMMEERQLLGADEMRHLLEFLEGGSWPERNSQDLSSLMYWNRLEALLKVAPDREEIRRGLMAHLQIMSKSREVREGVTEEVKSAVRQMKFVRIPGGPFEVADDLLGHPDSGRVVKIEMPYDLEVMDVPVTQAMWVELMGENVLNVDERIPLEEYIVIPKDGKEISWAPNFPVHNLSTDSMIEFANRLSAARGLPAAYAVRLSTSGRGRAENGSLKNFNYNFTSDFVGDVQGFRLPTHYEWLRLVSEFTRKRQEASSLDEFYSRVGWFGTGRWIDRTLKEVGLLGPIVVDGQSLFDLLGNVEMAVHETFLESFLAEKRPMIHMTDSSRHMMNFSSVGANAIDEYTAERLPEIRHKVLRSDSYLKVVMGFRLVRSVPRKEAP